MPPKKIGDRMKDWFRSLPIVGSLAAWLIAWQDRRQANREQLTRIVQAAWASNKPGAVLAALVYAALNEILGDIPFVGPELLAPMEAGRKVGADFGSDPQGFLQDMLHKFGSSDATQGFAEFVGTIITEPVVSLLEKYATEENPDPHAMARSFHGIASGLPWAAEMMDSILKAAAGEHAPSVGRHVMSLYWGLGLGFLGWQTLAPLLSSGLQPNLERYYNRLYRPTRFTPAQVTDLFALGDWSADKVRTYLQDQGWRDEDIETYLRLSYRSLGEGVLWDLFDKGQISKAEMDKRLRGLGYNPADIPLVHLSHEKDDVAEAGRFLISTVKSALRDGRMGEEEFRQILTDMKYAVREIDLIIEEINLDRQQQARDVTLSNVRTLYSNRVIGRDEAVKYLTDIDYSPDLAGKLVQAWDNEDLPKPARINKSTILEAFTKGVFTRDEAKTALQQEAGYNANQSELLVKIEETPFPERVKPPEVKGLTLSLMADFVQLGLVTRGDIEARAELDRYTPEDKEKLVTLLFSQTPQDLSALEISPATLEDAYLFGLITRDQLLTRFTARGMPPEDAELEVKTFELANPQVFGEFVPQLLRRPSVGDIQLAFQRKLIDEAGFRQRLQALGYNEDAVTIFLFNAQYQAPVKPKELTKADLLGLYGDKIISRAEAERRLLALGYLAPDVELLLQREAVSLADTLLASYFEAGLIDLTGFAFQATQEGFSAAEIDDYLAQFTGV
jgi:hypothetical protein